MSLLPLWQGICELADDTDILRIRFDSGGLSDKEFLSNLCLLEKAAYILTTEDEEDILIKVLGESDDGDGWRYFCPRGCEE